jgi:hypothetical protein
VNSTDLQILSSAPFTETGGLENLKQGFCQFTDSRQNSLQPAYFQLLALMYAHRPSCGEMCQFVRGVPSKVPTVFVVNLIPHME